ncbi:hypothetical protein BRC70_07885, partial [Halobacteriales archaeon QH_6_68_27]
MPAILFVAGLLASAFVGGVTLGLRVTATLGEWFVAAPAFTLGAAVVVLAVTGVGILLGNLLGVSVSTTGAAVGADALAMGPAVVLACLGIGLGWGRANRVADGQDGVGRRSERDRGPERDRGDRAPTVGSIRRPRWPGG